MPSKEPGYEVGCQHAKKNDDRENLKGLSHVSGVMSGKKLNTLILVYNKLIFSVRRIRRS